MELAVAIVGAVGALLAAVLPPIVAARLARPGVDGVARPWRPSRALTLWSGMLQAVFLITAGIVVTMLHSPGDTDVEPVFLIEFLLLSAAAGMFFGYCCHRIGSTMGATVGYVGGGVAAFLVLQMFILGDIGRFEPSCLWIAIQGVSSVIVVTCICVLLFSGPASGQSEKT